MLFAKSVSNFLSSQSSHDRQELYITDYDSIDWPAQRNSVASVDVYCPHSKLLDILHAILGLYENCAITSLRKAALKRAYDLVVYEDENTEYQTLGPVSKMLNLVCQFYVQGTDSEVYKQHAIKRADFMWLGVEGLMMCGTNGSQLWDVGFITQALVETGLAKEEENKESLRRALEWLDHCQIRDNPKHYEVAYRQRTKGAWPFSTREQNYTVSDCTGEGLKSVLYLQNGLEFVTFSPVRLVINHLQGSEKAAIRSAAVRCCRYLADNAKPQRWVCKL